MRRRMSRRHTTSLFVCLVALASALTPASFAQLEASAGLRVDGVDRVTALIPREAKVVEYENAGYRLRTTGGRTVEIETDLGPLRSSAPFELPSDLRTEDEVAVLSHRLAAGANDRYTAVSRVLNWISRNIRYHLDRDADQAPQSVLERRSAYCTGTARLAVAMLSSLGVEAREVPGFVVGNDDAVSGFHRWIEVHYPDRGWVFSDPLTSHHFVPATYVRLAAEELMGTPGPTTDLLVDRVREVDVADVHPLAPPRVLARGNRDRQYATTLRVEIEPPSTGSIVLTGNGQHLRNRIEDGRSAIVGLRAGLYDLTIQLAGGTRIDRVLGVGPSPVRSVLTIRLPDAVSPVPGDDPEPETVSRAAARF